MIRRLAGILGMLLVAGSIFGSTAARAELPPGGTFIDDDTNIHQGSIEAIFAEGITKGCESRGIKFCPKVVVDRGQMAAFLARALDLPAATEDYFVDDGNSIFEGDINKIREAGITLGCNPPENDRFCPTMAVHRDEMAAFLARGFPGLMPDDPPDKFTDDDTDIHQANINKIAEAGITKGCNPPDNTLFCPRDKVTRDQMAAFLARALGLTPIIPPPQKPIERVSKFTTYFDCCQNRVTNIRLMAQAVDGYVVMPGETFSIDRVVGPTTASKGYLKDGYLKNGQGHCCVTAGGVSQFGTTMYNAVFWSGFQIDDHRPHSAWISRYPLGIEATLVYSSIDLKFTNDTTTPITIRTRTTSTSVTVELWGNQGGWEMRGYHPRGNRSSSITVVDYGSPTEAKRVKAKVTGSAPGQVKVVRTLTQDGVPHSQTWYWNYLN